jgi:hypothetical protein
VGRYGTLNGLVALLTLAAVGCGPPGRPDVRMTRIQELQDKVEEQGRLLVEREQQIADQAKQIQKLEGLTEERRLDQLVHVEKIEIERLSGGYDDDHDGIDEGVVVYLRLIDADGDTIKVAGGARVRLFDLSRPEGSRVVGELTLQPGELRPMWFGRFLTSHYTIKVPWSLGVEPTGERSITVVVSFTELLSGRVLETQKMVEANAPRQPND